MLNVVHWRLSTKERRKMHIFTDRFRKESQSLYTSVRILIFNKSTLAIMKDRGVA